MNRSVYSSFTCLFTGQDLVLEIHLGTVDIKIFEVTTRIYVGVNSWWSFSFTISVLGTGCIVNFHLYFVIL